MRIQLVDISNHYYAKNDLSIGTDHEPVINIITCKYIKHAWIQIEKIIGKDMAKIFSGFKSIYDEILFETICQLMKNEYDVPFLWQIIAQNFCNAMMHNDSFALNHIEKYMNEDVIKQFPRIIDWKGHIIKLAMPYEKGKIYGGIFIYDWIYYILNATICIGFNASLSIVFEFFGF